MITFFLEVFFIRSLLDVPLAAGVDQKRDSWLVRPYPDQQAEYSVSTKRSAQLRAGGHEYDIDLRAWGNSRG
jgi:hypothetical protein